MSIVYCYMYLNWEAASLTECCVKHLNKYQNNFINIVYAFVFLQRMVVQKVFPALTAEFHNHKMIPFVLPNVLMIAEESSIQEYATLVLPALEPVFAVQDPIQVCSICMY